MSPPLFISLLPPCSTWQATEPMVRTVLQAAAGFVWEFTLPRGPDGRIKGFAFAAFTCLAHAQKAIQMVNGKVWW